MSTYSDYPNNIYWRDALRSDEPIVEHTHWWTCGDAMCFWHGNEAREAYRALNAAAINKPAKQAAL